jgi:hypothetical protein
VRQLLYRYQLWLLLLVQLWLLEHLSAQGRQLHAS